MATTTTLLHSSSTSRSHSFSNKSASSAATSQAVIFGLSFLHLDRSCSNSNKSPGLVQVHHNHHHHPHHHPHHNHNHHNPQFQHQYGCHQQYHHQHQIRRRKGGRSRRVLRRHSASSTDPNELNKLRLLLFNVQDNQDNHNSVTDDRNEPDHSIAIDIPNQHNLESDHTSHGSSTFFCDTASTVASPTTDSNPLVSESKDSTMPRSFQVQRREAVADAVQPQTNTTTAPLPPPRSSSSSNLAPNLTGVRPFPSYKQYEVCIESSNNNNSNKKSGFSSRSTSTPPILGRFVRQTRQNDSNSSQRAPSTATASSINDRLSKDSPSVTSTGRWTGAHCFRNGELTREEFESLPVAIRRKYFSTLERLRFAQELVDGPAPSSELHIFEDTAVQNLKRRRKAAHRASRFASDSFADRLAKRRSLYGSQTPTYDSAWFANLPDKIKKRHFSRDEQIALSRHKREITPADEAVYKIGRRSSRNIPRPICIPSQGASRDSMDSITDSERRYNDPTTANFMDSFRWLDEDEDLDLKLFLDDYHANLREALPQPKYPPHQPSFRRHLSMTKIPFGRSSMSSSRPGTKGTGSPVSPNMNMSPSPSPMLSSFQHEALPKPPKMTRRSRTLSLINTQNNGNNNSNKLVTTDPMIDPEAAHYQDPEARLKLRVYLASPQKFDEAVEFGFPSKDVISARPSKEIQNHKRRESRALGFDNKENYDEKMQTFLADDKSSTYSEDISMCDPDSPLTPQAPEKPNLSRPLRLASESAGTTNYKSGEPCAAASSREMTLRMTLTRPDLRACEDQIYGWQNGTGRKSSTFRPGPDQKMGSGVTYVGAEQQQQQRGGQSMEQVFASMDHDHTAERGVMKRFWDRVRHH